MRAVMPSLFVSHGEPDLGLGESPARHALAGLAAGLPRPDAIIVATAHWETDAPTLSTAVRPQTLHDFSGFDRRLRRQRYAVHGEPALAARAASLLREAGLTVKCDPTRGLDHGVWVPLSLMYPCADIPVVALSVQPFADAAHHLAVGRALAPLRADGVLIIGSGALTHDTRHMTACDDAGECQRAAGFAAWMSKALACGDVETLLAWEEGPGACTSHSTAEHLWPLFVALGAAEGPGTCLHASVQRATMAMQVWRFDGAGQ